MLACRDVTQLISRSMDSSLPIGERIGVRVHLLMCKFCARYERQLLMIREILRRVVAEEARQEGPVDGELSEEARERIRKSLRNP
jgi:anti-sigma factor RsiW